MEIPGPPPIPTGRIITECGETEKSKLERKLWKKRREEWKKNWQLFLKYKLDKVKNNENGV